MITKINLHLLTQKRHKRIADRHSSPPQDHLEDLSEEDSWNRKKYLQNFAF